MRKPRIRLVNICDAVEKSFLSRKSLIIKQLHDWKIKSFRE